MTTRYIPQGMVEFKPSIGEYPKHLCEVWVDLQKNTAIFYKGKSSKYVWYNRFRTADDMKEKIIKTITSLMAWEDKKVQRKEERKAPHTLKVGDILYTSWGYDQTNIDYYQVTKIVSDKTVEIREISSRITSSEGHSNYVTPVKDGFITPKWEHDTRGRTMTKRVGAGNLIKIADYATAYPWDGSPKYETALGYGH